MMSPTIEAACRALASYLGADYDALPFEAQFDLKRGVAPMSKNSLQWLVVTVLRAIREPSEGMIVAGIIERHDSQTPEAWKLATANIYTAMIDSALTE